MAGRVGSVAELVADFETPDGRLVDETGVVTEVDETEHVIFVRDIAAVYRELQTAGVVPVTDPYATFHLAIRAEFDGVIERHIDLAVEYPVGEEI